MKSIRIGIVAVALAFGSFRAVQAQPTLPSIPTTLSITLTATYQAPDVTSTSGTTTTSSTKSVKVTSSSILSSLAKESGSAFPSGSYLAQDGNGNFEALTKSGTATALQATTATIDFSGTQVYSGTVNSSTGQQTANFSIYAVITYDDGNGNSFTVDGLVKVTATVSAPDKNGNQKTAMSFSGSVAGSGAVIGSDGNSDTAVYSGTVSGTGSQSSGS